LEGSPAAEAKIKENDQILEVGAMPFRNVLIYMYIDVYKYDTVSTIVVRASLVSSHILILHSTYTPH